MKKTILTIMVAAMMLVAFTACEQTTPNFIPKNVSAITIQQNEDFLVGEMFDPSRFSVYVEFTDGSPAQTIDGSDIVTATGLVDGRVGASTIANATYGYSSNGSAVTATRTIRAYAVESVTLANLPTTGETDGTDTTIDTSAVTASVAYNNGAATRELATNEFEVEATSAVTYEAEDVVPTVKVYLFGSSTETSAEIIGTENWTVDISVKAKTPGDVADVAVVYLYDGEEIAFSGLDAFTPYLRDVISVQLWTVDSTGTKVAQVTDTNNITVLNGGTWSPSYTVSSAEQGISFIYTYTDEDGDKHQYDGSVTIPDGDNYISTVTGLQIAEARKSAMQKGYNQFSVTDLTCTATNIDGSASSAQASTYLSVVTGQSIPSDAKAGDTYTLYVNVTTGRGGSDVTLTPVTVTVV